MATAKTKSFTTSKRATDDDPVTFTLDKVEYTATRPKDIDYVGVFAADGNYESTEAVVTWVDHALDEQSRMMLTARLRNPKDDLDVDTIVEIFRYLMEEFTGRPTGS